MSETSDFLYAIKEDLKSASNEDHREFSKKMIPSKYAILGVKTPEMRRITKHWYPKIKHLSFSRYMDFILALNATEVIECILISYELIAYHKSFRAQLNAEHLTQLLPKLDNWATVDTFAMYVTGPVFINNQITDETIMLWSDNNNVWIRRLAIVTCIPLIQKTEPAGWKEDITIELCLKHLTDKETIIHKAISWALRSLIKYYRKSVEEFLQANSSQLKSFIRREVENKLYKGKKN